MKKILSACCMAFAVSVCCPLARADTTLFVDPTIGSSFQLAQEAAFLKAAGTASLLVNFDDVPAGLVSGHEWSDSGIVFSPVDGESLIVASVNYTFEPHSLPNVLGVPVEPEGPPENMQFAFDVPRHGVGFWLVDSEFDSGNDRIKFLGPAGEVLVDIPMPVTGYSTGSSDGNFFIGVVSDLPIARVVVDEHVGDGERVDIDDVYASAPTGPEVPVTSRWSVVVLLAALLAWPVSLLWNSRRASEA